MNAPLDPLSDFRSDGYGLDDARRARMRSRVLDAIPDDAVPGAVGPVATAVRVGPRPTPDIDLRGVQTLESVPADDRSDLRAPTSRPRWPNSRRLLVAAAVATIIGLMAIVAGASRSSDRPVGTLDATTMSLDELANVAGNQPDRTLAPGEFQYIRSTQGLLLDDGSFLVNIDDNWHSIDGRGRRQSTAMIRPAGAPTGTETDVSTGPVVDDSAGLPSFGPFSYDQLRAAPTNPSALLEAVRAAMPGSTTWAFAEQIANFEAQTTTPSAVRAAGLRALSELGFRPVGKVTDPLGRTGMGFQVATDDGTEVLAFDPATGRALGYWTSPADGPATAATATRWMAWSNDAVTDRSS